MSLTVGYRRSGGIAGLELTAEVSDADLDDECTTAAAALLAHPPPDPGPARGADRCVHELTVSDGTTTRAFTWPENSLPDVARPLVAELARRAEPRRR